MLRDLQLYEHDLPASVRELIQLIGWRAALALVREMPGARFYCALNGPDEHSARFAQVAEVTSARLARRIYEHYRGSYIEVPNCQAAIRAARSRWIRAAYDAGRSVEEICLLTGVSRRMVFYVLKQADTPHDGKTYDWRSGQLGLF